ARTERPAFIVVGRERASDAVLASVAARQGCRIGRLNCDRPPWRAGDSTMSATVGGPLAFRYFPLQFWRPSAFNTKFDPTQANAAPLNQRALLIGQLLASGTAPPNIVVQAYSQSQVNILCGVNSMLALKYAAYRAMDPFGEVWMGPVADAGGGTAAA